MVTRTADPALAGPPLRPSCQALFDDLGPSGDHGHGGDLDSRSLGFGTEQAFTRHLLGLREAEHICRVGATTARIPSLTVY